MGTAAASANDLDIWPCWKDSAATTWNLQGEGMYGITMLGVQRQVVSASATVTPGVGPHHFGLCYRASNGSWKYNKFGYVAAQRNP